MCSLVRIALLCSLVLALSACSGMTGTSTRSFDHGMLNATYYGVYQRPLRVADASPRAEDQRRDEEPARQSEPRREQPQDEPATARRPAPEPEPVNDARDSSYDADAAAGYVCAVYQLNETDCGTQSGAIVDIYRHAQESGTVYHSTIPAVGDLVFYHNTHDRNGDHRNNDWYTHVGIVESVDESGTVSVLSYIDGRVARTTMNLEHASDDELSGATVNTSLRDRASGDADYTQYLAGELFAGFGGLLGNRSEVLVIDDWEPTTNVASR